MKRLLIIVITISLSLTNLLSQSYISWENYSFSQRVTGIDFNKNDIWISTQGGLVKYNKKNGIKKYYHRANANLPDNNLIGLFCNADGSVWIGGKYYGIGNLNGEQCTIYNHTNSGLPFDQYNSKIKVDKNGNVWIASFRWMAKFDGSNWKTWITGSDISAFPIISDFLVDANGVVWICSTDGLGKIENDKYSIIQGIYGGINQCMGMDNNKNIWIGIDGRGLYLYNGSTFTNYNTSNSSLPTNSVFSISFDSHKNMWLATDKGLVKFNVSGCQLYKPAPPDTALLCLKADDNDTIWCGTFNGNLLCFNGSNFNSIDLSNSPLKGNYINDILIDKDNNLWGGSANGLFEFDGETWSVWNRTNSNIPTNVVVGLDFDSENKLWFSCMDEDRITGGDYGGGLTRFDGQTMKTYKTDNSGLLTNTIWDVFVDAKGLVWLGTCGGGIMSFDRKNKWLSYNVTNSGIANNIIQWIRQDKSGYLWMGHIDAGISVFNPDSFQLSVNNIDNCLKSLTIFPNPVKDIINIKINTTVEKNVNVRIYDLNGKLISSLPDQTINQNNSIIHYKRPDALHCNQIYILKISCDSDQFSTKIYFEKK